MHLNLISQVFSFLLGSFIFLTQKLFCQQSWPRYEVLWSWSTFKVSCWKSSLSIHVILQAALNFNIVREYYFICFLKSFLKRRMWNRHVFFTTLSDFIFLVNILTLQCPSVSLKNCVFSLHGLNCNDIYSLLLARCLPLFMNTLCSRLFWHSEF